MTRGSMKIRLFLTVAALLLSACAKAEPGSEPTTVAPTAPSPAAGDAAGWDAIPRIVAEVEPSVVAVLSENGEGSGVIYRSDGTIVTNYHVVAGARRVQIQLADGSSLPAAVLATDEPTDLAVLRIERDNLPPARFATSLPTVGELAIAIGNPLGLENTVTAGIISGVQRSVPASGPIPASLVDLIQTDAPISPGNSGGALVNGRAEVVGISVAYVPPGLGAVSIGFAIPAPAVTDVVEQLLAGGQVRHAFLGIEYAPITPQIAQRFGLETATGVLVVAVVPGSPAATAGLVPGDAIASFDGQPVREVSDLLVALRRAQPGQVATLSVLRGGQTREVRVVLSERTRR
ncbi:MAG: S1C family serine protease [Nitriliruptorales bacterium]